MCANEWAFGVDVVKMLQFPATDSPEWLHLCDFLSFIELPEISEVLWTSILNKVVEVISVLEPKVVLKRTVTFDTN